MSYRRRLHPTMFVGLAFLAIANVARLVLERHTSMPEDPRDALVGLLFGVAIATLFVGLWKERRTRRLHE